jgi:predicted amidohydrolase
MKISLIQSDISWNNPSENVRRCAALASEALASQGEVLIFPEMFTCGFSMPTGNLAEESSHEGREFLRTLASQHSVFTIGSTPEVGSVGENYNTAWIFGPDGAQSSYRKIHPFSLGGEADSYSPGTHTQTAVLEGSSGETLRCTALICYDLRFAPLFWAEAPRTDLFVVVANWPVTRREHWLTLLRARAIENQAYVAGVNRVGVGGGLTYSGDSVLFAPDGTELGALGDSQGTLTCDVTSTAVAAWREKLPALRDRRPEIYPGLALD